MSAELIQKFRIFTVKIRMISGNTLKHSSNRRRTLAGNGAILIPYDSPKHSKNSKKRISRT